MKSRTASPSTSAADPSNVDRSSRATSQKYFTMEEIADALDVSPRTVSRWIKDKKLVAHKFGRLVRIAASDFAAFAALHRGY